MEAPGRNDACPCGSGRKYKKCCLGKTEPAAPGDAIQDAWAALDETVRVALQHQQEGRLQQAAELYQQVLQIQPGHADALHLLGLIAHQTGQCDIALDLISRAIEAAPATALYYCNIGPVLLDLGQREEALACYQKAAELQPDYAEAFNNIGHLRQQQGRLDEAAAEYRKAIAVKPDYAEAHYNLGNTLREQKRLEEALDSYRTALSCKADFPNAHNNAGLVLVELGQDEEALLSYPAGTGLAPRLCDSTQQFRRRAQGTERYDEARQHLLRAREIKPDYAEVYCNLGNLERATGQLGAAIAQYRHALSLKPDNPETHYNLGCALADLGQCDDALAHYRRAIELEPGFAAAYNTIAVVCRETGKYHESIAYSEQALALKPDFAEPYNNIGNALTSLGRSSEAIPVYRESLRLKPRHAAVVHSNLLFTMLYDPSMPPDELFAESRKFSEAFEAAFVGAWPEHTNVREPGRRLKIGYVSADFRNHAIAYFIEQILANHDKSAFEIYCYYNHTLQDQVTERLRKLADHWLPVHTLSDGQLASRILSDGIDILLDLSGHTAGNRLPVFARKPAPVQATWLGCAGTTGLDAMDYRLTDGHLDPPGMTEDWHAEELVRLSASSLFLPDADAPPVNRLPALDGKPFTFACLNNPAKLNENVIALWARILKAAPSARMMLGNAQAKQEKWLLDLFAQYGVGAERLLLQPRLNMGEYLALHHQVDLALDPFPYNGGTTSLHSMWMGVPVVTLAGDRSISRVGVAAMCSAGLPQFVAQDEDGYAELSIRATHSLQELDELRQGLRARMLSRPNADPVAYTRELEKAYRNMWQDWCKQERCA